MNAWQIKTLPLGLVSIVFLAGQMASLAYFWRRSSDRTRAIFAGMYVIQLSGALLGWAAWFIGK